MAQSDARFGYQANLSKEDHDLSRPFGFTCCPGQLLPVHADVCSAGDFLRVKHVLPFMRTQPLAAPAMVDVKIHFETFFVPFQMIYQPFENSHYSLNNFQSNFYVSSEAMNNALPLLNYNNFVDNVVQSYSNTKQRADCFRLADLLGLGATNFLQPASGRATQWRPFAPNFFPWQLLAYHTIFQYYYRLDDKSQFNSRNCNWDSYYNQALVSNLDPIFMEVHQRPWDFDYFTSMYRSPIVSDANMQKILPNGAYTDLLTSSFETRSIKNNGVYGTDNESTVGFSSGLPGAYSGNDAAANISTAMLRQMFANEKLAMITGRTRKNYDSQVLAHLGVKVPVDVKHDLQLIGRDTYMLKIGEVTSLASTEDAPLGDLAGKGWATSDDGQKHEAHDFRCPVDGVVMTLFSVEPLKRYYGGFERQNAVVDCFDFPRPEFDRLGNVPMYYYETGGNSSNIVDSNSIIGWKERYYQWKRRSPKTTWAFAHSNTVAYTNSWSSYMLASQPFSESEQFRFGQRGAITNRGLMQSLPSLEDRFYIPPSAMDDVMLVPFVYGWDESIPQAEGQELYLGFDDEPWLIYQRDPFIVDCYPTVKKVSWMSKDGEPIYPW